MCYRVAKYLLSRAVRAAGIKVVFTGKGANEMLGGYPYFRVDALNDNAALSAAEKSALLDEMLGANAATRALLMPEQVNSPEMQAVQCRLGWLPATLNMAAAQTNSVATLFRDDLPASVREFRPLVSALDRLPVAQRVAGRDRLNQMLYVNAKTVTAEFHSQLSGRSHGDRPTPSKGACRSWTTVSPRSVLACRST